MIVSWNELQRTCQKAFRGLGVPAGADDDSASAMLWLQARGLDALTPLGAALSALECATPRPLRLARREGEVAMLDADGQPAVSIASDALDFAVARAVEGGTRAEVLLVRVEGGCFVAGALAHRPMSGCCARVEWWDGETQLGLDVASDGACRLSAAPPDRAGADGGPGRQTVSNRVRRIGPDSVDGMELGRGPSPPMMQSSNAGPCTRSPTASTCPTRCGYACSLSPNERWCRRPTRRASGVRAGASTTTEWFASRGSGWPHEVAFHSMPRREADVERLGYRVSRGRPRRVRADAAEQHSDVTTERMPFPRRMSRSGGLNFLPERNKRVTKYSLYHHQEL